MAVEIKGYPPLSVQDIGNGVQNKASVTEISRAQPKAPGNAQTDKVSLTSTSVQLRDLEQTLADYPVVDAKRVEAIKQNLLEGTYQVDAKRVAVKLIGLEGSLHVKA